MEYCDLGSLDSAIADARFKDMVSLQHLCAIMILHAGLFNSVIDADGHAPMWM